MAAIIGIQFRSNKRSKAHEQESILRVAAKSNTEVVFIDALDEVLAWKEPEALLTGASGLVLGGSGDFDFDGGRHEDDPARTMSQTLLARLTPLFQYVFDNDIHTLGICYGHQIMGAFKGVKVVNDTKQSKIGTHKVQLFVDVNDHFLFTEVPLEFDAQYGHKDVLASVPSSATLLAEGANCKVAALQYQNNIYSVQFHPEMSAEDVVGRLKNAPGYLPEGTSIEALVRPSEHAELILQNYFTHIRKLDSKKAQA